MILFKYHNNPDLPGYPFGGQVSIEDVLNWSALGGILTKFKSIQDDIQVMTRVLVAVDGNKKRGIRIAEELINLAEGGGDWNVTVLNVFEEFEVVDDGGRVSSEDLYDETDVPESVEDVTEFLESRGFEVTKRLEHGDPSETIVNIANEIDADFIAIAGRKRSPTGKALFGSVTQSVLLSANRPVLTLMVE